MLPDPPISSIKSCFYDGRDMGFFCAASSSSWIEGRLSLSSSLSSRLSVRLFGLSASIGEVSPPHKNPLLRTSSGALYKLPPLAGLPSSPPSSSLFLQFLALSFLFPIAGRSPSPSLLPRPARNGCAASCALVSLFPPPLSLFTDAHPIGRSVSRISIAPCLAKGQLLLHAW
jgi:hypothetical protein